MKKTCFVVMGYGWKTDYKTGRKLDLDRTYNDILKPVIEELDMECIRSDEIIHSGIIDKQMFDYLISADIVIADISTYNCNAFYELGVRHALKPYTTIIISEDKLEYPFDIQHSVIRKYKHLGSDIGYNEVLRFRSELKECIENILNKPDIDSPVYTYIHDLNPPEFKKIQISKDVAKESLKDIISLGEEALSKSDFSKAKNYFGIALDIDKNNQYLLQRLILATYKEKEPDEETALNNALTMIEKLSPDHSNDPETLGLASSINKRLWDITKDNLLLDKAIEYSEKCFYISNDYYNGINLAFLFNLRSSVSKGNNAIADKIIADRIRNKIIKICLKITEDNFDERSDCYWVVATMEEAYFGVSDMEKYLEFKEKAIRYSKEAWQRQSTEEQIGKLKVVLAAI